MDDDTKLPKYLGLGFRPVHDNFEYFAHKLGTWFMFGTVGGSFYHFFKGLLARAQPMRTRFGSGINAIRVNSNSIRTGGKWACFTLVTNIPAYAIYKYRGGQTPPVWTDKALSFAVGGAIMWAPRGLRSASLAALGFGSFCTVDHGMSIMLKNVPCNTVYDREKYRSPYTQAMATIWDHITSKNRFRNTNALGN